jgi:hypothetical protein
MGRPVIVHNESLEPIDLPEGKKVGAYSPKIQQHPLKTKEQAIVSKLEETFPVDIDRELEPFFNQNPQSIEAIQKSIEIAHRYFEKDRLYVEIIQDPESSELDRLSVIIRTSLDTTTALEKISAIDAESSQDSTLRNILIHVEFQ